jgi:hypothetical protein
MTWQPKAISSSPIFQGIPNISPNIQNSEVLKTSEFFFLTHPPLSLSPPWRRPNYSLRYNPQAFTAKPKRCSAMTSLTERRKATLFLILAAILWSTAGVFVKALKDRRI